MASLSTSHTLLFCMASALLAPSASQNSETFQPVCQGLWDWIRDPNDCSRFWRCSWGAPIQMPACGDGLILNDVLHVCVRRGSLYDDCPTSAPVSNPTTTRPTPTATATSATPTSSTRESSTSPTASPSTSPTARTTASTTTPTASPSTSPTVSTTASTTSPTASTSTTPTTPRISTTTSSTQGSTLGFSIFEFCSRDFNLLIPHPEECQAYYNCSRVYDVVPAFFEQYLQECPYPQLFDSQRRVCDSSLNVQCGTRREALSACDYRGFQCPPNTKCTLCDKVLPSCVGKADGQQAVSVTSEWTATYVTCRTGRVLSQDQCDRNKEIDVPQVFSPVLQKCVHLYDVPAQNGGLQPACSDRTDGLYPEDNGRSDLFFECSNRMYMGVYSCPPKSTFNAEKRTCS